MVASYLIAAALPLAVALVADVRAPLSVQGRFRAPSMVANPPASTDALNAPSTDVDSDSSSNGGLFNTLQMLRPRRQEPGDAEEVEEIGKEGDWVRHATGWSPVALEGQVGLEPLV